jgi:3-oxoacyl-[acyl-carrier protein] reductase
METKPLSTLTGKRALVCGSTQGIGRACAIEFARLGAGVTLLARDAQALRKVKDELAAASPAGGAAQHGYLRADFSRPDDVAAVVRRYLDDSGPTAILVNNTGGPPPGPIFDADPEAFRAGFTAHLVCNQILVQLLVPGMKELKYGRIINIISTSVKQPIPGLGVSNTIRGAVASWSKTLATELAPFGITVNNILPGFTDTQRLRSLIGTKARDAGVSEADIEKQMKASIPMGRFGAPEELAAVAGFLASPASSYLTGVSLPIDGGRTSCL